MERRVKKWSVGIDIGGTNTVMGLVSEEGHLWHKKTMATKGHGAFEDYCDVLVKNVLEMPESNHCGGIGIGAPSASFQTQCIEYAPNLPWSGTLPLVQELKNRTGFPVFMDNDANAAALGESKFGKGKNVTNFGVITLGTGLGCGMMVDGHIFRGPNGLAGELGHIVAVPGGRPCACGLRGCLETYVSATGIQKSWNEVSTLKLESAAEIWQLAKEDNPVALKIFEDTGRYLAHGLSIYISLLNPSHIFFTGGVAAAGDLLVEPAARFLPQFLLPQLQSTCIVELSGIPKDDAGLLGAAALVI